MRVDTGELEALAALLQLTAADVAEVGAGLAGMRGVGGLAVGADAVLDAIGDLVAQWLPRADLLAGQSDGLSRELRWAVEQYARCEAATTAAMTADALPTGPRP